jgi:glutamine synthetase
MVDAVAPGSGLGPVGEVWLTPDLETLRYLPYAPRHARVMANITYQGHPWPWCPREFLRRMVERAAAADLAIQAAFEPEFYLLRREEGQVLPADETNFAATLSMDIHAEVIDAIADALIGQGIQVEHYYPESGPGQQEISVRYGPALVAADQQVVLRETVKAVARQHDLVASFIPKLLENAAGSGCHLHLSLWRHGENITPAADGTLSPPAQAFTAGVLEHLPALMALTVPSSNSYRRLRPQCWSGAFQCWGYDNREAAVRIPSNYEPPSPTHIELKTVDASANPYLALGAVIAAGLDGLERNLTLPAPMATDPATLTEAARQQQRASLLPQDLGVAIAALEQNGLLMEALGPLGQTYLAVRQAEWQAMEGLSLAQEVKLLLERY